MHSSSKGSIKVLLAQWNDGDSAADVGASERSQQASAGSEEGAAAAREQETATKRLTQRGFEGWGTPGACLLPTSLLQCLSSLTVHLTGPAASSAASRQCPCQGKAPA